jgi:glutaconate CoA-transferase subunit A
MPIMHNKKIAKKSNELKSGQNELFTNPDADVAREFFRTKSRALKSKLSTVEEIVRTYLHDVDYIGIGGFGANRIPTGR